MGLWDKLKQIIFDPSDSEKFDKGKYDQKNQKSIAAFAEAFDLNSIDGINSITIDDYKKWKHKAAGVPAYPEQILRKKATEHKRNGNMDLAIECLKKSNEFLPLSDYLYSMQDYERLVDYLYKAGRFDEARAEKAKIEQMFSIENDDPDESCQNNYNELKIQIERAIASGTDLLEMSEHPLTCGECAKYQGRVFSISGKSDKFPKLPDSFLEYGGVHEGCNHTFYPYYEGMSISNYGHKNIVAYSNRPFVDNRTKKQKEEWEKKVQYEESYEADKENYYWCLEHLGAISPKSFSGYRRMKNTNSANFQKLKKAAKEQGRDL